jgi:hypothetical protein
MQYGRQPVTPRRRSRWLTPDSNRIRLGAISSGPSRPVGRDGAGLRLLASSNASFITGEIMNATGGAPLP